MVTRGFTFCTFDYSKHYFQSPLALKNLFAQSAILSISSLELSANVLVELHVSAGFYSTLNIPPSLDPLTQGKSCVQDSSAWSINELCSDITPLLSRQSDMPDFQPPVALSPPATEAKLKYTAKIYLSFSFTTELIIEPKPTTK